MPRTAEHSESLERLLGAPPLARPRPWVAVLGDYCALTKPGITLFVAITAGAGFLLAGGAASGAAFVHALLATSLSAAGAAAVNQYLERGIDARMGRTRGRPLPAGRLRPTPALAFGLLLTAGGLAEAALFLPPATALLLLASFVSYVAVYTPLKRTTTACTLVGAIPGALPVLAGWTAAGAPIAPNGLHLFGILFLWQIPHFLAIAWICRDDYSKGGLSMLSVGDEDGRVTARQSALYALFLLPVSIGPAATGLLGSLYGFAALALSAAYFALALLFLREPAARTARRLFLGSLAYLPLLILAMAADRLLG